MKRQKGQRQALIQGKGGLGMKGQRESEKEKACFVTHKKPSVATRDILERAFGDNGGRG